MARVLFKHVYKRFGNVAVVQDINLDIQDKEFLVLVGPSGCGNLTTTATAFAIARKKSVVRPRPATAAAAAS